MTHPIIYNPTALAVLNGAQVVDQQQIQILNQPLATLTPGMYPVAQALPMLPVGPLRDAALSVADVPGVQLSYRMVPATAGGPPVPQYFFREALDVVPTQGVPRITTGGPGGTPVPPEGAVTFSLGGATLLVGSNILLYKSRVPAPLIGPALGGSFAFADFLTGSPAAPANNFLRTSFASMGVATTANYGWAYGLDALGVPMGSSANTYGTIGGTLLTFAPVAPRVGIPYVFSAANPVYSPAFSNAFGSAVGVGLTRAAGSNPYIFMAQGGPAGGFGVAGGVMQGVGAFGAVLAGSSFGGWVTEEATGMNDENDPYGQMARMARDRMYSDAWGFLGRSPLGHLMGGLTVACGYSDEFAEAMTLAEGMVARDKIPQIEQFSDGMNATLVGLLINTASPEVNQPMNVETLEAGIRTFYQNNASRFALTFLILSVLRRNRNLPSTVDGMLNVASESGTITDRQAFTAFATKLGERELQSRILELEARFASLHLTMMPNGQVSTGSGEPYTQDQSDFIHGDGARLSAQIMRLTNALAGLDGNTAASDSDATDGVPTLN